MVSVLLSILTDFANSAKAFFSGFWIEVLGVVVLVIILKIGAEYCKNRVEVNWYALNFVAQAQYLSEIMSMDWEHYAFLMSHLLSGQGYRTVGSSVNDLSGIDIVAEKDGKRVLYRFGRSTAEMIYEQQIRSLLIKAQQFNASSGFMVTAGEISDSASRCVKNVPVTLVKRSDLIEWLNQYAGARLRTEQKENQDSGGFGHSSYSSSDGDALAA